MRPIILCLAISGLIAARLEAQVYDSPASASEDEDFALQGEYADSTRGIQVIAEGEGQFQIKIYAGGLPGAGWDGSEVQALEADDQVVTAMTNNIERVERKSPTLGAKPPSGAVVLFDGTEPSLKEHWRDGARMTDDGLLMQGATSKETFGDYSMHLEFRLPFMPKARGQGRGNSGLYHQGRYETQILDSFGLEGKNNEAGGIYEIRDPDLNLCLPPLVWQTYDVDFTAARYDDGGKKTANAKITVRLNGVVVHRDVELPRSTRAAPVKEGPADGPIYLQDHGNPVRFRNIWVKPRDVDAEARRPIVPGFERFHALAADAAGGRLLLGELNCVACHETDAGLAESITPKQAPILDGVGKRLHPEWMVEYIANPHGVKPGTTMPDLLSGKDAQQRRQVAIALTNYLIGDDAISVGGKRGNTGNGERLFHESGCLACHLPRDGRNVNRATSVPLVGLTEKYSRGSLQQFLKNPLAVRPSGRMPRIDLGDNGWNDVAQYLTGDLSVGYGNRRERPKQPNMRFQAYLGSWEKLPDLDKLEPSEQGVSRGLDIGVAGRDNQFAIRFDGFLPIAQSGTYNFRLSSDDGSRLFIDGKRLIDNDGIHPNVAVEGAARLEPGIHTIRVEYFENGGDEVLSLQWAGPGVESGFIDQAIQLDRESAAAKGDSPSPTQAEPDDPSIFVYDPSLAQEGRKWFASLGCAQCHVRHEEGKRIESTVTAPRLAQSETASGCLSSQPASSVPQYDLTRDQIEAIAAALQTPHTATSSDQALVHRMTSLNCYACHKRGERGGTESDRNSIFISTIPEMGDEGRLPPPLDGAGDKLRRDWMVQLISQGDKSRPYMKTHMPGFGDQNAKAIVDWLVDQDKRNEATIVEINQPSHRVVSIGRRMVGAKGLACVSCHTFGKFKSTGIQAIALDTMAQRIRRDWFHRYLPDPQQYRPGTRMPTGYPEGKSTVGDVLDGDRDRQLSAMWAFLEKGTGGGVPEGIVSGMIELKPESRPIIYRNFIAGVSPRGIAVGYPEKVNLCWDAENLSLALIWQDRFIDASKHWVGRGPGTQTPLGGSVIEWEPVVAVAALPSQQSAWPREDPRTRGYQFLGYRLDTKGRPGFRYRHNNFSVEDRPVALPGQQAGSFRRELTIQPDDAGGKDSTVYFRAAQGDIEVLADGWFLVNDAVRIRVTSSAEPVLRSIDGGTELIVPVHDQETIVQDIVW